ncbi:hypothetical protein [Bacillus toyonensis]|uniref:hypothetical protein n=1 Tax=Bacillus toyonensis TaxID=155322 RepID=UPI0015D49082|nr:hypothetical protein [Bacillus toyonensis]
MSFFIEVVGLRADTNLDEGVFKKGSKMIVNKELKEHLEKSKEEEGEIPGGLKW